jgi:hypothetical protein
MDVRSLARNAARAQHLRIRLRGVAPNGKREWSLAEIAIVQSLFPNEAALCKALPHRSWIAIRSRAGLLGLRKKQHRWFASDLSRLKRMWSAGFPKREIFEALPRYTADQVIWQVRKRKFRRPDKRFCGSGHPVIDQIKDRAKYLHYSMGDIDELAGTKGYFYSARWIGRPRPNPKAICRAIEALDGVVTAVWH